MKKRYVVELTYDERRSLKTLISSGSAPARKLNRARILLKADRGEHSACVLTAGSFGMDIKPLAKLPLSCFREDLGRLLESRVALRPAREPSFGPSGRSSAGIRRLGGRAHVRQKRRNHAMDTHRCQATGVVMTFLGQPQIRYVRSSPA